MSYLKASVGYYPKANSTKPSKRVTLGWIMEQIRDHNVPLAMMVGELRELRAKDEAGYKKAKAAKLPAFTISGYGAGREAAALEVPSGLIQVDLDNLDAAELVCLRSELKRDRHVAAGFISPSGAGLKLAVAIDPNRHAESFAAAQRYFEGEYLVTIDPRTKDRMRLCFLSYDPEAWVNEGAIPLPLDEQKGEGGRAGADIPLHHSASLQASAPSADSAVSAPSASFCITPQSGTLSKGAAAIHCRRAFAAEHAGLVPLYSRFIENRFTPAAGRRNEAITLQVPFLFRAVAPAVVRLFSGHYYDTNVAIFNDPREQHMSETEAMIEATAASYLTELTPTQREIYELLTPPEQAAFRICQHLAFKTAEPPPPTFFLSCDDLGNRLGCQAMVASRLLHRFAAYQILIVTAPGAKGALGQPRRATTYAWILK